MAPYPKGHTISASDDRQEFFKKFFPTALYGGLASGLLLFWTSPSFPRTADVAVRCVEGALLYPLSRFLFDNTYYLLTGEHFELSPTVCLFAGVYLGLFFGVQGSKPRPILGSLIFSVGAIIFEGISLLVDRN